MNNPILHHVRMKYSQGLKGILFWGNNLDLPSLICCLPDIQNLLPTHLEGTSLEKAEPEKNGIRGSWLAFLYSTQALWANWSIWLHIFNSVLGYLQE